MTNNAARQIIIVLFLILCTPAICHADWKDFFPWFGKNFQLGRDQAAGGVEKGYTPEQLGLREANDSNLPPIDLSGLKFDDPALTQPAKKESLLQKVRTWIDARVHSKQPDVLPDNPFGPPAQDIVSSQSATAIMAVNSYAPSMKEAGSATVQNLVRATNVESLHPVAAARATTSVPVPTKDQAAPAAEISPRIAVSPTRNLTGQPMTAVQALEVGVGLGQLRRLNDYEKLTAIANGVDPKRLNDLYVVNTTRAPRVASQNPAPTIRPYLGAGQHAIDRAFTPGANNVPVTRPYLGAGQQAIDKAFTPHQREGGQQGKSLSGKASEPSSARQNFASLGMSRGEAKKIQSARTTALAPPQQTSIWEAPGKPVKYVEFHNENRPLKRRHRPNYRRSVQSYQTEYDNSAEVAEFALMLMLGVAQGVASSYVNRPRAPRYAPAYRSPGRTCFITAGLAVFGVRAC